MLVIWSPNLKIWKHVFTQGEAQRRHCPQFSSHPHQLCDGGQPARQPATGAGGLEPQTRGGFQQAKARLTTDTYLLVIYSKHVN